MTRNRPLSVLLALTLVSFLAACPKNPPPEEPQPAPPTLTPDEGREPDSAPDDDADIVEVTEWQDPDETEVQKLSATEIERLAAEFTRQGALRTLFFESDKSELSPDARQILAANAAWLRGHPDFAVLIAGHCDERHTEEYNLALGERRAESVRRYLVSLGVAGTRTETISYGEEQPVDRGHDESAWSKNRRAEFEVKPL